MLPPPPVDTSPGLPRPHAGLRISCHDDGGVLLHIEEHVLPLRCGRSLLLAATSLLWFLPDRSLFASVPGGRRADIVVVFLCPVCSCLLCVMHVLCMMDDQYVSATILPLPGWTCIPVSSCPCVHVSLRPCIPASIYPCVPASSCPCVPTSMYPCVPASLCPYIPVSMCPYVHVSLCPRVLPHSAL